MLHSIVVLVFRSVGWHGGAYVHESSNHSTATRMQVRDSLGYHVLR
jgi:hypothetical protein